MSRYTIPPPKSVSIGRFSITNPEPVSESRFTVTDPEPEPVSKSRFTITDVEPVSTGRFTVENVPDIWTMNMVQGRIVFSNLRRDLSNISYFELPHGAIVQKKDLTLSANKPAITPAILLTEKPGYEPQHTRSTRPIKNMGLKSNMRTARNITRATARKPQENENERLIARSELMNRNLNRINEEAHARIENPVRPKGMTDSTWEQYIAMLANHKTQHATRKAKFAERQAQYAEQQAQTKKGGRKASKTYKRRK